MYSRILKDTQDPRQTDTANMGENKEGGAIVICSINNQFSQAFQETCGFNTDIIECVELIGDSDQDQVCTLAQFH